MEMELLMIDLHMQLMQLDQQGKYILILKYMILSLLHHPLLSQRINFNGKQIHLQIIEIVFKNVLILVIQLALIILLFNQ